MSPDPRTGRPRLSIINPLPNLLAHYAASLHEVIAAGGAPEPVVIEHPGVEMDRPGIVARFGRSVDVVRTNRRIRATAPGNILSLWPSFNDLEPFVWAGRPSERAIRIVVHDPLPLRKQYGAGSLFRWMSQHSLQRSDVELVVHTSAVADDMVKLGWPRPILAGHPIAKPGLRVADPDGSVLVVGQWKPTRDHTLLERLGRALTAHGYRPQILGRGWPSINGWEVSDAFLSESDFTRRIQEASCVLIPYERYYQSGVAVRAAESSVPVVGRRHAFVASLFGDDWVGQVDGDRLESWISAIDAASQTSPFGAIAEYRDQVIDDWRVISTC